MIHYNLRCAKGHAFESWFQSSSAYETQEKRKLVSCPVCGSTKVERAIMAPQVVSKKGREQAVSEPLPAPTTTEVAAPAPTPLLMAQEQRTSRQTQGIARPYRQERRQCWREVSERSPQDALWRYRTSPDLRRGLTGRGKGLDRRRRRGHAAPDAARRPELTRSVIPGRCAGIEPGISRRVLEFRDSGFALGV